MSISVRVARPDEYEQIGEMTHAAYLALEGMPPSLGAYGRELANVSGRAEQPGTTILVAEDTDGTLLGDVTYIDDYGTEFADFAEYRPGSEDLGTVVAGLPGFRMLAVAPAAQGRGAGEVLTRACAERAVDQGAAALVLHTTGLMPAAQRLYRRIGFDRWPEIDYEVGRRNPVPVVGFKAALPLPPAG